MAGTPCMPAEQQGGAERGRGSEAVRCVASPEMVQADLVHFPQRDSTGPCHTGASELTGGGRVGHSHVGVARLHAGGGGVLHRLLHHVLHRLLLHLRLLLHGGLLHGGLLHRRLLHDGGRKATTHGNLLQRSSRLLGTHLRRGHRRRGLRRCRSSMLLGRRLGGSARRGGGRRSGAGCHSRVGGRGRGGLGHRHHLGRLLCPAPAGLEVLSLHIQLLAAAAAAGGLGRLADRHCHATRLPHSSYHATAAAAGAGAAVGAAAGSAAVGGATRCLVLKAGGWEVGIFHHKLLGSAAWWQKRGREGRGEAWG